MGDVGIWFYKPISWWLDWCLFSCKFQVHKCSCIAPSALRRMKEQEATIFLFPQFLVGDSRQELIGCGYLGGFLTLASPCQGSFSTKFGFSQYFELVEMIFFKYFPWFLCIVVKFNVAGLIGSNSTSSVSVLPPALRKIQEFILHFCVLRLLRFNPALLCDDFFFLHCFFSYLFLPSVKRAIEVTWNCSLFQFQFANYSTPEYKDTGKGFLKLQLINQRSDFSFVLFSGGLLNVC